MTALLTTPSGLATPFSRGVRDLFSSYADVDVKELCGWLLQEDGEGEAPAHPACSPGEPCAAPLIPNWRCVGMWGHEWRA